MHGLFVIIGWFMMLYTWFLGCLCVADKEFRMNNGKSTVYSLFVAWAILGLIYCIISSQ